MPQNTTLIVTAMPNPNENEAMQTYLQGVGPLLAASGGQMVCRLKVNTSLNGEPPYGLLMVMDFDDRQNVEALFASDAYTALIPARNKGFSSLSICLSDKL